MNTATKLTADERAAMAEEIIAITRVTTEIEGEVEGDYADGERYLRDEASDEELREEHTKWLNNKVVTRKFVDGQKLVGLDLLDAMAFVDNFGMFESDSDAFDAEVASCMASRSSLVHSMRLHKIGKGVEDFATIPGEWIMLCKHKSRDEITIPDPWMHPKDLLAYGEYAKEWPELAALAGFEAPVEGVYLYNDILVFTNENDSCLNYVYFKKA